MVSSFTGTYGFLSNFSQHSVFYAPTAEHMYQSQKTLDPEEQNWVLASTSPGVAKKRGQQVTMRKDWEQIKLATMENIVYLKFATHDEIRAELLRTGSMPLVEGNNWGDRFWGAVWEDNRWNGQNWLGRILMLVRSKFHLNPLTAEETKWKTPQLALEL